MKTKKKVHRKSRYEKDLEKTLQLEARENRRLNDALGFQNHLLEKEIQFREFATKIAELIATRTNVFIAKSESYEEYVDSDTFKPRG